MCRSVSVIARQFMWERLRTYTNVPYLAIFGEYMYVWCRLYQKLVPAIYLIQLLHFFRIVALFEVWVHFCKGRYMRPHHICAVSIAHSASLVRGKLIFHQHTKKHGWCKHEANMIFNAEITCTVYELKFKYKNISKLCTIFPLCSCKNWQNWFAMCSGSNSLVCVHSSFQTQAYFQNICLQLACEWCSATHARPAHIYRPLNRACNILDLVQSL